VPAGGRPDIRHWQSPTRSRAGPACRRPVRVGTELPTHGANAERTLRRPGRELGLPYTTQKTSAPASMRYSRTCGTMDRSFRPPPLVSGPCRRSHVSKPAPPAGESLASCGLLWCTSGPHLPPPSGCCNARARTAGKASPRREALLSRVRASPRVGLPCASTRTREQQEHCVGSVASSTHRLAVTSLQHAARIYTLSSCRCARNAYLLQAASAWRRRAARPRANKRLAQIGISRAARPARARRSCAVVRRLAGEATLSSCGGGASFRPVAAAWACANPAPTRREREDGVAQLGKGGVPSYGGSPGLRM
jgi:hypothetical protein